MELDYEVKSCHCCFPFYCGHKKIIISNMNYEYLKMVLKYSPLIKKGAKD